MARLVKFVSTDRGRATGDTGVASVKGVRLPSALGVRYDSGTKAAKTIAPAGANNDLVWTAKYGGTWGDDINVTYTDPSANYASLAIEVDYKSINVKLATNDAGTITTTAAQIIAAVAAHAEASELVVVTNAAANDGSGVVTAIAKTYLGTQATLSTALAGNNNDLDFTAVSRGVAGNSIDIVYLDPAANNASLSVSVSGSVITFSLATDGGGLITTTADQIKTALAGSAAARALVTAVDKAANDGTGVVIAMNAATGSLAGGTGGTNVGVGERIYQLCTPTKVVVVDLEDGKSARNVKRNNYRLIPVGTAS